eukprot:4651965-Pyramimonas_sp.AAC.1
MPVFVRGDVSTYDVPTACFRLDCQEEFRAPRQYRNWRAFTCRALGGDTRSTLFRALEIISGMWSLSTMGATQALICPVCV